MPKIEAIAPQNAPAREEKVIPVRVAITKTKPAPKPASAAANPEAAAQNANQPATGEGNPAADPATTAESVKLSPQLSALARKEQAFRQRELQLKQRETDLQTKLAKADQFEQLQQALQKKDFSAFEKLGGTYEDFTNYLLNKDAGENPVAKTIQELQQQIADLKKGQEESAEQRFEETKSAYREEIGKLIATSDEFSHVKGLKREDAVLQLILDTWEEDGLEMTVDEACKLVEQELRGVGETFDKIRKPASSAPAQNAELPPPKRGPGTLTNDMLPSGATPKPTVQLHQLSEQERYAEARRRALAKRQQMKGT